MNRGASRVGVARGCSHARPALAIDRGFFVLFGGNSWDHLSLLRRCESTNHIRLAWQGEPGILYGVRSTPNVATGPWIRNTFSTGTNSVLATNALVEATCLMPTADANRFFRVLEP